MTDNENNKMRKQTLREKIKEMRNNSIPSTMVVQNPFSHLILWSTFLFIIIFLIWAHFAVLEEVTIADGIVMPLTHKQSIQNSEGGVIKEILVNNNDIVQKGQVLVILDSTQIQSALDQAKFQQAALQMQILRLNAEINRTSFIVPLDLQNKFLTFYHTQQALYNTRREQLHGMQDNYALSNKELKITQDVNNSSVVDNVDIIKLQRESLNLKSQMDNFNAKTVEELNVAHTQLATVEKSLKELQNQMDRTIIRSPVKGIVKDIRTSGHGGLIQPHMEIMTVIPLEDTLLVEAQVKPSQINFIKSGAHAMVKINTYDYSVYGGLRGVVRGISAETLKDDEGRRYYLVSIKTDKNYLGTRKDPLYILPGMAVSVEILTGKKTVLDYLLTPLVVAKDNALRVR